LFDQALLARRALWFVLVLKTLQLAMAYYSEARSNLERTHLPQPFMIVFCTWCNYELGS